MGLGSSGSTALVLGSILRTLPVMGILFCAITPAAFPAAAVRPDSMKVMRLDGGSAFKKPRPAGPIIIKKESR